MWNKLIAWEWNRGDAACAARRAGLSAKSSQVFTSKFFRRGQNSGCVVNAEMGPDVPVTMPEIEVARIRLVYG